MRPRSEKLKLKEGGAGRPEVNDQKDPATNVAAARRTIWDCDANGVTHTSPGQRCALSGRDGALRRLLARAVFSYARKPSGFFARSARFPPSRRAKAPLRRDGG